MLKNSYLPGLNFSDPYFLPKSDELDNHDLLESLIAEDFNERQIYSQYQQQCPLPSVSDLLKLLELQSLSRNVAVGQCFENQVSPGRAITSRNYSTSSSGSSGASSSNGNFEKSPPRVSDVNRFPSNPMGGQGLLPTPPSPSFFPPLKVKTPPLLHPPALANISMPAPFMPRPLSRPTASTIHAPTYISAPSIPAPGDSFAYQLDKALAQYRALEKERKTMEANLARMFPGKRLSSSNNLPVARLPPQPSPLDKFLVDSMREHARILTLVDKLERLYGTKISHTFRATVDKWQQQVIKVKRDSKRNEILCGQEFDIANELNELRQASRRVRTVIWINYEVISDLKNRE